jgi:hypothetical protein
MKNNIKIFGIFIVITIVGLSIANALNGHGIKGNPDLNPMILGSGTGTGSGSGTGSGTGTGTGPTGPVTAKYTPVWKHEKPVAGELYYPDSTNNKKVCWDTFETSTLDCEPGGSQPCEPMRYTATSQRCIEYL